MFQTNWDDLQVNTVLSTISPGCPTSVVSNIGAAEIQGVEIDLKALLTDNLKLELVAEYNNAEITETSPAVPRASVGDPLRSVPEFTAALGLEYRFNAFNNVESYARFDMVHIDERSFSDVAAGPSDAKILPAYDLLNLRIGSIIGDWEVVGFVDNITDAMPATGIETRPRGPGIYADGLNFKTIVGLERPRNFGIRFTRSF